MELKGKILHDFWAWYLTPENRQRYKTNALIGKDNVAKVRFMALSFTERYGVYVDFFMENGYFINNDWFFEKNDDEVMTVQYSIIISTEDKSRDWLYLDFHKNNKDAQLEVVDKIVEVYNQNKDDIR